MFIVLVASESRPRHPDEEHILAFLAGGRCDWPAIRQCLYDVHCSETRASETRQQLRDLAADGLIQLLADGAYSLIK